MAEKTPYFPARAEVLVGDANGEQLAGPGVAAADHFVMLHRTAVEAAGVQVMFGGAAVRGIGIRHRGDDRGRIALIFLHPGIHQCGDGYRTQRHRTVVRYRIIGGAVYFHHWYGSRRVAGV